MSSKILEYIRNTLSEITKNIGTTNEEYYDQFVDIFNELNVINDNLVASVASVAAGTSKPENDSDSDLIEAEIMHVKLVKELGDVESKRGVKTIDNSLEAVNRQISFEDVEVGNDDDDLAILEAVEKFENNKTNDDLVKLEDVSDLMTKSQEDDVEAEINNYNEESLDAAYEELAGDLHDKKYTDILKRYFGYSVFRPLQLKIIKSVVEQKRDNLVIMATGQGKSLCYQFPALYLNKLTVVISPLISLMEDQVLSLKMVNVEACFLGTAQDNREEIQKKLMNGDYRVLYLTPEFVDNYSEMLVELNKKIGICLLAVDECHCVSQWGNDFRPSYRRIGESLREKLSNVPFMGLTATATPNIRLDIVKSLKLKNPIITITSFDRPNLYITVSMKSNSILKDLKSLMVDEKKTKFDGSTIIYCQSKKLTGEVVSLLKTQGIKCDCYHADLTLGVRKTIQKQFLADEIDVIVATVAFGMGIDKPDIRNVIHYGAPRDLESYYQEIGRAGRDGSQSKCHVFYNSGDFILSRYFLKDITQKTFLEHKNAMLNKMQQFLTTNQCRRRLLLKHFDQNERLLKDDQVHDLCCDNCTEKLNSNKQGTNEEAKDYTEEARKLFQTVSLLKSRFGIGTIVEFLIGSKNQKLLSKVSSHFMQSDLYNSVKYKNENWWKLFGQQLVNEGYLRSKPIQGSFGCTIELTAKAESFLNNQQEKISLYETKEMKAITGATTTSIKLTYATQILPMIPVNSISLQTSSSASNRKVTPEETRLEAELFKALLNLRNEIANETGISAHKVANNKILLNLAHIRPSSIQSLENIEDFANEKAETIGSRFIQKVKQFCQKNELKLDNFDTTNDNDKNAISLMDDPKIQNLLDKLPQSKRAAYVAFEFEKKSIEEVGTTRGIVQSTVFGYLETAVLAGLPLTYSRLGVTDEIINRIEDVIRKPPINSNVTRLATIKEQVQDISWDHLKISVALIKKKYGLCADDEQIKSDNKLQTTLALNNEPSKATTSTVAAQSPLQQKKVTFVDTTTKIEQASSRPLPSWIKKRPSVNENEQINSMPNDDASKAKKKKFQI